MGKCLLVILRWIHLLGLKDICHDLLQFSKVSKSSCKGLLSLEVFIVP